MLWFTAALSFGTLRRVLGDGVRWVAGAQDVCRNRGHRGQWDGLLARFSAIDQRRFSWAGLCVSTRRDGGSNVLAGLRRRAAVWPVCYQSPLKFERRENAKLGAPQRAGWPGPTHHPRDDVAAGLGQCGIGIK